MEKHSTQGGYNLHLVRAKCVRCPWALQAEHSNLCINSGFILFFLYFLRSDYFSPRRGCPRILKFCMCSQPPFPLYFTLLFTQQHGKYLPFPESNIKYNQLLRLHLWVCIYA